MGNKLGSQKGSTAASKEDKKREQEEKKLQKKEQKTRTKNKSSKKNSMKKKLARGGFQNSGSEFDTDLDGCSHFTGADSESGVFHSAENLSTSPYLDSHTRSEREQSGMFPSSASGSFRHPQVLSSRDFRDGFSLEACIPPEIARPVTDYTDTTSGGGSGSGGGGGGGGGGSSSNNTISYHCSHNSSGSLKSKRSNSAKSRGRVTPSHHTPTSARYHHHQHDDGMTGSTSSSQKSGHTSGTAGYCTPLLTTPVFGRVDRSMSPHQGPSMRRGHEPDSDSMDIVPLPYSPFDPEAKVFTTYNPTIVHKNQQQQQHHHQHPYFHQPSIDYKNLPKPTSPYPQRRAFSPKMTSAPFKIISSDDSSSSPTTPIPQRKATNLLSDLFRSSRKKKENSASDDDERPSFLRRLEKKKDEEKEHDKSPTKKSPIWKTWERSSKRKSTGKESKLSIFGTSRKTDKSGKSGKSEVAKEKDTKRKDSTKDRSSDSTLQDFKMDAKNDTEKDECTKNKRENISAQQTVHALHTTTTNNTISFDNCSPKGTISDLDFSLEKNRNSSPPVAKSAAFCIMRLEELERNIEKTIKEKFPDAEPFLLRKTLPEDVARGSKSLPTTPSLKKKLYLTRDVDLSDDVITADLEKLSSKLDGLRGATRYYNETFEDSSSRAKSPVIVRRFGPKTRHASISPKIQRAKTAAIYNSPSEMKRLTECSKMKKVECVRSKGEDSNGKKTYNGAQSNSNNEKSNSHALNQSKHTTPSSSDALDQAIIKARLKSYSRPLVRQKRIDDTEPPQEESNNSSSSSSNGNSKNSRKESTKGNAAPSPIEKVIVPSASAVFGSVSPKLKRNMKEKQRGQSARQEKAETEKETDKYGPASHADRLKRMECGDQAQIKRRSGSLDSLMDSLRGTSGPNSRTIQSQQSKASDKQTSPECGPTQPKSPTPKLASTDKLLSKLELSGSVRSRVKSINKSLSEDVASTFNGGGGRKRSESGDIQSLPSSPTNQSRTGSHYYSKTSSCDSNFNGSGANLAVSPTCGRKQSVEHVVFGTAVALPCRVYVSPSSTGDSSKNKVTSPTLGTRGRRHERIISPPTSPIHTRHHQQHQQQPQQQQQQQQDTVLSEERRNPRNVCCQHQRERQGRNIESNLLASEKAEGKKNEELIHFSPDKRDPGSERNDETNNTPVHSVHDCTSRGHEGRENVGGERGVVRYTSSMREGNVGEEEDGVPLLPAAAVSTSVSRTTDVVSSSTGSHRNDSRSTREETGGGRGGEGESTRHDLLQKVNVVVVTRGDYTKNVDGASRVDKEDGYGNSIKSSGTNGGSGGGRSSNGLIIRDGTRFRDDKDNRQQLVQRNLKDCDGSGGEYDNVNFPSETGYYFPDNDGACGGGNGGEGKLLTNGKRGNIRVIETLNAGKNRLCRDTVERNQRRAEPHRQRQQYQQQNRNADFQHQQQYQQIQQHRQNREEEAAEQPVVVLKQPISKIISDMIHVSKQQQQQPPSQSPQTVMDKDNLVAKQPVVMATPPFCQHFTTLETDQPILVEPPSKSPPSLSSSSYPATSTVTADEDKLGPNAISREKCASPPKEMYISSEDTGESDIDKFIQTVKESVEASGVLGERGVSHRGVEGAEGVSGGGSQIQNVKQPPPPPSPDALDKLLSEFAEEEEDEDEELFHERMSRDASSRQVNLASARHSEMKEFSDKIINRLTDLLSSHSGNDGSSIVDDIINDDNDEVFIDETTQEILLDDDSPYHNRGAMKEDEEGDEEESCNFFDNDDDNGGKAEGDDDPSLQAGFLLSTSTKDPIPVERIINPARFSTSSSLSTSSSSSSSSSGLFAPPPPISSSTTRKYESAEGVVKSQSPKPDNNYFVYPERRVAADNQSNAQSGRIVDVVYWSRNVHTRSYHSDDDVARGGGIPEYYDDRPLWNRRQKPPGQISAKMASIRRRERRERWLKKRQRNKTDLMSTCSSEVGSEQSRNHSRLSLDDFEDDEEVARLSSQRGAMGSGILTSPKYAKPIMPFLANSGQGSSPKRFDPNQESFVCRRVAVELAEAASSSSVHRRDDLGGDGSDFDTTASYDGLGSIAAGSESSGVRGEDNDSIVEDGGGDKAAAMKIPGLEETFDELISVQQLLDGLQERAPPSAAATAECDDGDALHSTQPPRPVESRTKFMALTAENIRSMKEQFKENNGRQSRLSNTNRTESDLDLYSEYRDDASTDSNRYADDEDDDDVNEPYTTAEDELSDATGGTDIDNIVISCTFYNSNAFPQPQGMSHQAGGGGGGGGQSAPTATTVVVDTNRLSTPVSSVRNSTEDELLRDWRSGMSIVANSRQHQPINNNNNNNDDGMNKSYTSSSTTTGSLSRREPATYARSNSAPGSYPGQNQLSVSRDASNMPAINSDEEFWVGRASADRSYQQLETAAGEVSSTFQNAREQMTDIQHHLQALRRQMEGLQDELTSTSYTLTPDGSAHDSK